MRLSPSFQVIMQLAAHECVAGRFGEIEPEHLLMALLRFAELEPGAFHEIIANDDLARVCEDDRAAVAASLQDQEIDTTSLRRRIRAEMGQGDEMRPPDILHRSDEAKQYFVAGYNLAIEKNVSHLTPLFLLAAIMEKPTRRLSKYVRWRGNKPKVPGAETTRAGEDQHSSSDGMPPDRSSASSRSGTIDLGKFSSDLRELRRKLNEIVLGQGHAIDTFIEGMFSAEIFSSADSDRKRPKGIFVFAGPPGVGKTFLAETAAGILGLPFKRLDMSGYSGHEEAYSLVGIHKSYKGAHPGILTGFVAENPRSVLLFDEIEKAHPNTIHLFLQTLDSGRLEDKYTEQIVQFRDTIIIFTTNAGRALYDDPNRTGVQPSNSTWHRKTILDALEKETDPRTGVPFFPAAICSRMATGYPVMFNKLGVNDLERICGAKLQTSGQLLEKTFNKPVEFGPLIPLCLLLREGVFSDARTISSQAESFVREELFRFALLFQENRLNEIIASSRKIVFDVDNLESCSRQVREIFHPVASPNVLLVADEQIRKTWEDHLEEINWHWADDHLDCLNILKTKDIDFVLLDLWVGNSFLDKQVITEGTVCQFDFVPGAATTIARGQEILRNIHRNAPESPCFLVSFGKGNTGRATVDDELFLACARSGGAWGVIETSFLSTDMEGWRDAARHLQQRIITTGQQIRREKNTAALGAEQKTLSFETAPEITDGVIRIRLRNLRFEQTVAATDVSAMLLDGERPAIGFDAVFGAAAAKTELEYIVKWLRDPRHYMGRGLRPPRGILLHGHPGTGKTLLARALAGESRVPFFAAAATNFVTKWQGSGPENVRELFLRARRNAPSILFIDEIDAIGKRRGGGGGADSAAEQTLNALLVEMDGFAGPSSRPVIVIAATNLVELLDDALRRRFDREIEVDRPDRAARVAYLHHRLSGKEGRDVSDTVIERLAGQSANMTIAELERVIELAGRMAAAGEGIVNDRLLEEAFERMRMGERRQVTDPAILKRIARHEAGHCLVGWLQGNKPIQVTIVGRGGAGGYVEHQSDEDRVLYTRPELEGMIRQAMAGRAAELVCYGEEEGLSSGVGSDLQAATRYAEKMVREFGMAPGIGQVAFHSRQLGDGPLAMQLSRAAEKIISEQMQKAVEELTKNRKYLDLLVDELLEKNRLTLQELEQILPPVTPGS